MSAMGLALGGWLFLNLIIIVALLNRRSMPSVREKLFWWVIGERPFESPDHRKVDRSQPKVGRTARRVTTPRHIETSAKLLAFFAVICALVAGSVIFVSTHPRSIAACASSCG
jgi:hypothetical protein